MNKILLHIILFVITFFQINIAFCQNLDEKNKQEFNKEVFSLKKDKQETEKLIEERWIQIDAPIEIITSKLLSEDDNERLKAVVLLGKINDSKQIAAIEKTLSNDNSYEVRAECAKTLRYLDSYRSINVLKESLNDKDREVQMQSAISLANLGEKEKSFEKLQEIFKNGNRREKLACNMAFRDINNNDAIIFLKKAINDNNPYVAVDAAIILAQLEYYDDAYPTLEQLLKTNPNNSIKRAAMRGLAYIGDEKSIQLITEMTNYPDNLTSKRAKSFLKLFK